MCKVCACGVCSYMLAPTKKKVISEDPSCMNMIHGCIRQAPLYRHEMEPNGISVDGGLEPRALTR